MSVYSSDGFCVKEVACKVHYIRGIWEHSVAKIENPIQQQYYFKTHDEYFKHIIATLKENILRKVPDLGLVSIQLIAFDSSNIMHNLILTVAYMLKNLMRIKEHIRLSRMACIVVTYNHTPIFIGSASF
jgi:hypothetical protein